MQIRPRNPLLPQRQPKLTFRWRTGPAAGTVGLPQRVKAEVTARPTAEAEIPAYKKDPRGRKPKEKSQSEKNPAPKPRKLVSAELHEAPVLRTHTDAGKLNLCAGAFLGESNSGWGANLDMIGLAHGAVGCGVFTQASRLSLPGFVQGVESFSALHACTDLTTDDLEDGGDTKLAQALDEAHSLFPLARGVTILSEASIPLVDANVKGIAKTKTQELGPLIVSPCDNDWHRATALGLKRAGSRRGQSRAQSTDIALPFYRKAAGLVWIVSKLLRDIGLNPVHEITGSSTSDMARIGTCGLVLGFAQQVDTPDDFYSGGYAQLLRQWFDIPLLWTCFISPSATDASLRAIAARFDAKIQRRTEQLIAANRTKVDATIARYRPRLEGRLVLHFMPMTEEQLEPYRLLGLRIGNANGWTGKTGRWRVPRLVCDPDHPSEKAVDSYIAEAKPDLVLHFGNSEARGTYEWRKHGQTTLPFTPLFDRKGNAFWGYDGFALFAAALDRHINAPWRKLMKPPWPNSG